MAKESEVNLFDLLLKYIVNPFNKRNKFKIVKNKIVNFNFFSKLTDNKLIRKNENKKSNIKKKVFGKLIHLFYCLCFFCTFSRQKKNKPPNNNSPNTSKATPQLFFSQKLGKTSASVFPINTNGAQ